MTSSPDDLARRLDVIEEDIRQLRSGLNTVRVDACTAIVRTNRADYSVGDGLRDAVRTNRRLVQLVLDGQRRYGRQLNTLMSETHDGFAAARADLERIVAALGSTS